MKAGSFTWGVVSMPEIGVRIFSLAEANEAVPKVEHVTAEALRQIEDIRTRHEAAHTSEEAVSDNVLEEVETILQEWAQRVSELGGRAKGYFTVDFQSADPEMLYCWTYGEDEIAFTHKVWENFRNRRPLATSAGQTFEEVKWVH
jgi:hypothetical protein